MIYLYAYKYKYIHIYVYIYIITERGEQLCGVLIRRGVELEESNYIVVLGWPEQYYVRVNLKGDGCGIELDESNTSFAWVRVEGLRVKPLRCTAATN